MAFAVNYFDCYNDVEHRNIRFDTYAKEEDTIYSQDMQNTYLEDLIRKRTVYYACFVISSQIVSKGNYRTLRNVVVSFILTSKSKDSTPVEVVKLRNEQGEVYSELIALYNVYVPTVIKAGQSEVNESLRIFSTFFSISSVEDMESFIDLYGDTSLGNKLISRYSKVILRGDLEDILRREYFDMKITEEDINEARKESRAEGRDEKETEFILRKSRKGQTAEFIADDLDIPIEKVRRIIEIHQ